MATVSFSADSSDLTSAVNITLSFDLDGITNPASANDYTVPASGSEITLTIPAGAVASAAVALTNLGITDDARVEGKEQIGVNVNSSLPATTRGDVLEIIDDDAIVVLSVPANTSVAEGGNGSGVAVSASFPTGTTNELGSDTVFTLTVEDGTAGDDDYDYAPSTANTVTIPSSGITGSSAGSLTGLSILDDTVTEGPETVKVKASSSLGSDYDSRLDLTVDDADTTFEITASPETVVEGPDAQTISVAARFTGGVTESTRPDPTSVSVEITGAGGSGEATIGTACSSSGVDFVTDQTNNTFTFNIPRRSTQGSGTFNLTACDDSAMESAEQVKATGKATVDGTEASVEGTLNIVDTGVLLSWVDSNGNEVSSLAENSGSNRVFVKAELPGITATSEVLVGVKVRGGSATLSSDAVWEAGEDFRLNLPTDTNPPADHDLGLRIPAGGTSDQVSITVVVNDDNVAEGAAENILLQGDNVTVGTSTLPVVDAALEITDDDSSINLTFTTSSGAALTSLGEDGGAQTVRVVATLDDTLPLPTENVDVTVNVGAAGSTATEGASSDYTPSPSSVTVTVPMGTRTGTSSDITLTLNSDTVAEGSEFIRFTGSATGYNVNAADLPIDDPESQIFLTLNNVSAAEDADPATSFTVTAAYDSSVTASTIGSATAVLVTVAGSGSKPADSHDFSYNPTTVSIPVNMTTSGPQTLGLTITDDDRVDDGAGAGNVETLAVGGTAPAGFPAISPVTVSITDDDHRISWSFTESSAAYTGGTEGDSLGTVMGTASFAGTTSDLPTGTDVTVTLDIDAVNDAGDATDNAVTAQAADLTSPGTAITATISGGSVSATAVALTGYAFAQDTAAELPEVVLAGGSATDATETYPVDKTPLTITDDDSVISLTFGKSASEVSTDDAAEVTASFASTAATSDIASATEVTLTFGTEGTATAAATDFTAPGTAVTVSIPASATSSASAVSLSALGIADDTRAEGTETISVDGSTTVGLAVTRAYLPVVDSDLGVTLLVDTDSATDGDQDTLAEEGTPAVRVRARFTTATVSDLAADTTVTVNAAEASPASATGSGTDFTAPSSAAEITIAGGLVTGSAVDLTGLTLNNDNIPEGPETFVVSGTLSGGAADGTVTTDTLTIVDDDSVITFAFGSTTASEEDEDGRDAMITASFPSGVGTSVIASDTTITLTFGTEGTADAEAADFTAPGTAVTLTIPMGMNSTSSAVSLSALGIADDARAEGRETISVDGTASTGLVVNRAYLPVTDNDLGVTLIVDTDSATDGDQDTLAEEETPAVRVRARFTTATTSELSTATTVTVNAEQADPISARDGGTDFTAPGSDATITIAGGSVTGSAVDLTGLTLNNDTTAEGPETFVVSGTLSGGAADGTVTPDTLTIMDDDSVITLTLSSSTLAENSGTGHGLTATASFPSTTDDSVLPETTVTLAFDASGTATAEAADFTAPGTAIELTIPAQGTETAAPVALTGFSITDDNAAELSETISVTGSATGDLEVVPAALSITDNDTRVVLSLNQSSLREDQSASILRVTAAFVSATTSSQIDSNTVITLSVVNGSATSPSDYTYNPSPPNRVTIPANQTSSGSSPGRLTGLTILQTIDNEPNETLRVTGTSSLGAADHVDLTLTNVNEPAPPAPPSPPPQQPQPPPGGGGGGGGPAPPPDPPVDPPPDPPVDPPPDPPVDPPTDPEPGEPGDGEPGDEEPGDGEDGTGAPGGGSTAQRVCDGRFCDDDGSIHQPNIEQLAEWEITLGCDADNPRLFCPSQTIARRQMAAFLHRAVTFRWGEPEPVSGVRLTDVPASVWYRPFAEWVVSIGAFAAPQGVFNPTGEVTRGDMAVMMVAAFPNLTPVAEAQGLFTDVSGLPDDTVRALEGLYQAEVTLGCSAAGDPLRYCPERPVTRAQMASFFVRVLNIGVEISLTDASGNELTSLSEGADPLPVTITVSLPAGAVAPSGGLVVGVNVHDGTADLDTGTNFTAGEDARVTYPSGGDPPAGHSLGIEIPAGESSASAVITLEMNDDTAAEGPAPETILFRGRPVIVNERPLPLLQTSLEIADDDSALTLDFGSTAARERNGNARAAMVTASFASATVSEFESDTRVVLSFAPGPGTETADFTAPPSFRAIALTIPEGELRSSPVALTALAVTDDSIAEGPETIVVTGSAAGLEEAMTSLTITDDDAQIVLTLTPASLAEGGDGSAVRVSAAFPSDVVSSEITSDTVITLSATDGTAAAAEGDYDFSPPAPNTLTIPAGALSSSVPARLAGLSILADEQPEDPETILIAGRSPLGPVAPVPLTIEATEAPECEGRFCDDDGSVHESRIEQLVEWEITLGCSADDPTLFCPAQSIARRQMAAFLHRAVTLRWGAPEQPTEVNLQDVPPDAWYRPFADWLVSIGAFSAPEGIFNPSGQVTRADMAVMMVSAFPHLTPAETPQAPFTDTADLPDEVARAIESLYQAEITLGCSPPNTPLRFCPEDAVTRAQMASFFVRPLTQAPTTPPEDEAEDS